MSNSDAITNSQTLILQTTINMKTSNETHTVLLEANVKNIEATCEKIIEFAEIKGYRILGNGYYANIKLPTNMLGIVKSPTFDSNKQMKVLRGYINLLDRRVNMSTSNKFLHFLFKKVYKQDSAPNIDYSEKEVKIREARKAWKKVQAESDKLHLTYRKEKGDFYKKVSV